MRILIVTSVQKERDALCDCAGDGMVLVVSGIGRTNAAVATTRSLIDRGPFEAVINAGIAGALPSGPGKPPAVPIGAVVVGAESVYMEEGLISPDGFHDVSVLGFPLGDFQGNRVPADPDLLEIAATLPGVTIAGVATVATCSGTDCAAAEVVKRTRAVAEAMEGAAVLHAARIHGVPAIEIRAISNTTGDRQAQQWDIPAALGALASTVATYISLLRS